MIKSLSILLSMLLLISAAQVEAKLQIVSNEQHSEKRGAEKAPAKKESANKSEQRTEISISPIKLLITLAISVGGFLVLGVLNYIVGNPYKNEQNTDQHGGDPSSPSPAAPVSTSSATQVSLESLAPGVVHLSHGNAGRDELDNGAKTKIRDDQQEDPVNQEEEEASPPPSSFCQRVLLACRSPIPVVSEKRRQERARIKEEITRRKKGKTKLENLKEIEADRLKKDTGKKVFANEYDDVIITIEEKIQVLQEQLVPANRIEIYLKLREDLSGLRKHFRISDANDDQIARHIELRSFISECMLKLESLEDDLP